MNRKSGNLPHLQQNVRKGILSFLVVNFEVALELAVAKLVGLFVLAVGLAVLLNGVVGEVDFAVLCVVQVEQLRTCSDVALLVPVGTHTPPKASDQQVVPDIELSPVV